MEVDRRVPAFLGRVLDAADEPVRDLAVLTVGEPLPECVPGLTATDDVELDTRVSILGVSMWRIQATPTGICTLRVSGVVATMWG